MQYWGMTLSLIFQLKESSLYGYLALFFGKMDKALHRINHYPVDSVVCFVNSYQLDSELSYG